LGRAMRLTSEFAFGFGVLFSLAYLFLGGWVIETFIADPEARRAALDFLPFCAAVPILGVSAWQLDGLFLGTTQGKALRTAGIISAVLYLATDMALRPAFGNAGVWAAFLAMYVYRAAALGWFVPGLFRGLSRPPAPAT
ncbi:MAG: MATE family efflux transporter, partial [Pseudomonadota bacterium]